MSNVSFNSNLNSQQISNAELQKRLESQENFTAIDKEKLQQDTVELAYKAKETVKENWLFRTLRNTFGVEDPKKFVKSVVITLTTVVGAAILGNKMSNKTADWGIAVDKFLKSDNALAKGYGAVAKKCSAAVNGVKNFFLKSDTIKSIANAVKKENRLKPKCDMTRGYGRGFVSIFSLTPVDILSKVLDKTDDKAALLKKLVGEGDIANELLDKFNAKGRDNREFCEALSNAMRKHLGNGTAVDNGTFLTALKELQKGRFKGADVPEFINVAMKEKGPGGLVGAWWPVNIIDSIGKKIRGDKWQGFCRGNLGDSLVKFNAVNGTLADTKVGKLIQKSITVPTESYSNFVNDKSGLGVFLCASIISMWNKVQEAPKGKRTSTAADDIVGTIGSIALATPAAFAATYSLASLSKIQGSNIAQKGLKTIGRFFAMGLKDGSKLPTRFLGGSMRFALVMFVFSSLFSKPIRNVIHKIFGKPYDKVEEDKKTQIEAQQNQIIPELGITQQELLDRIQKNPKAMEILQTNPELVQKLDKNPKLLLDLLDGKDITKADAIASSSDFPKISQATQNLINSRRQSALNQSDMQNSKTAKREKREKTENQSSDSVDSATYIPSSEFKAKSSLSTESLDKIASLQASSDEVLKRAEKLMGY